MDTDLPIDINAISQMGDIRREDAVTVRFNLDLFSETAKEIDEASYALNLLRRERISETLFQEELTIDEIDANELLTQMTYESALFLEPLSFARASDQVETEYSIPTALIVIVLACSIFLGFMVARIGAKRRERD